MDFHFDSFADPDDRNAGFLLYKDILLIRKVSPQSLHKWIIRNCLQEGIISCYARQSVDTLLDWQNDGSLKPNVRSSYCASMDTGDTHQHFDVFLWFLENVKEFGPGFTGNVFVDETAEKIKGWEARHRPLFLGEDKNMAIDELKPESRGKAYHFWQNTEFQIPYFPGESGWIEFGFCVRRTDNEQACLMALYKKLLQKCSFQDFQEALQGSSITSLFDRLGLGAETESFRNFRSVIANSSALPSVWYLKSFIYDIEPNLPCQMRAVAVDYGFDHCRDATDRTRLRQAYRDVLDHKLDELELHKACLDGKIFEFCMPYFPDWEFSDIAYFRRLMSNPYPLIPAASWAGLVVKSDAFCQKKKRAYR